MTASRPGLAYNRAPIKECTMKQKLIRVAVFAALACGGLGQAWALGPQPEEVRKTIHAKVSVGVDGRVTDATLVEKKVPAVIESAILARVKGWRFDPVTANGTAVPAVTYAAFYACAMKSGNGYDLAVKYLDNGPLLENSVRFEFQPVVSEFSKAEQTITVKLTILPNGKAQLDDVVLVDVDPRIDRDVRLSVKHWLDDMRYTPEQVGGQPVATAMEWPLFIWSVDSGQPPDPKHAALYAKPTTSTACDAARAARDTPHPSDGQFKQHEAGAAPAVTPPTH
jgi:hypothetical protein